MTWAPGVFATEIFNDFIDYTFDIEKQLYERYVDKSDDILHLFKNYKIAIVLLILLSENINKNKLLDLRIEFEKLVFGEESQENYRMPNNIKSAMEDLSNFLSRKSKREFTWARTWLLSIGIEENNPSVLYQIVFSFLGFYINMSKTINKIITYNDYVEGDDLEEDDMEEHYSEEHYPEEYFSEECYPKEYHLEESDTGNEVTEENYMKEYGAKNNYIGLFFKYISTFFAGVFIVFFISKLSSCTPDQGLQKRVNEMELKIYDFYSKLNELDGKIEKRYFDIYGSLIDLNERLLNEEITFDPAIKRVGYIKSNVGNFFVICKDIKPHGDGQKITLMIGNPYNLTFKGFTIIVQYGMKMPNYLPGDDPEKSKKWTEETDKSLKSTREKTFKQKGDLLSGKWNKVSIVLSPAKPEEVGRLSVKLITDMVSLQGS